MTAPDPTARVTVQVCRSDGECRDFDMAPVPLPDREDTALAVADVLLAAAQQVIDLAQLRDLDWDGEGAA